MAPYVSNLFRGVATGEWLVAIAIPVVIEGHHRYTLAFNVPVLTVQSILNRTAPGEPYSTAISDRSGIIIARSSRSEEFLGKPLPGFAEASGVEGTWSGTNPEGRQVFRQYKRSISTGWLVSMGTSRVALEAPLYQSLWMIGAFALSAVLCAVGLALIKSREVATAVNRLSEMAVKLPGRHRIDSISTNVAEVNRIAGALSQASMTIDEQATQLDTARSRLEHVVEERTRDLAQKSILLEATLESMDQGMLLINKDGQITVHNRRFAELFPHAKVESGGIMTIGMIVAREAAQVEQEPGRRWIEATLNTFGVKSFELEKSDGTIIEIRTSPSQMGGVVQILTDITERRRASDKVRHLANHDALTGIANRALLMTMLRSAFSRHERTGEQFAVHILDLDHFKQVNDNLGHDAGDVLLCNVADRLKRNVRSMDLVARLGGDEFAIIQPIKRPTDAAIVAQRVIEALRQPYVIKGQDVVVGVSIGIAVAPEHGASEIDVMKSADLAMYRAKARGRSNFQYFDDSLESEARCRLALATDLRKAMAGNELEMHYQPIYRIADNHITHMEALIRWHHPERGAISPGVFIPVAEDSGLILELGEWIIQRVCLDATEFPDDVKLTVNLSPKQFMRPGVSSTIAKAAEAAGISSGRIEAEITETVVLDDSETTLKELNAIRALGISIALDDFGTGYSSLSYLQKFPFDKVKIDRSFVSQAQQGSGSLAIVAAVIELAHALNIETTAEGVETETQLEMLRQLKCTYAQGYLLSRPQSKRAVKGLFTQQQNVPPAAA